MAHYTYKTCIYESIPAEYKAAWEAKYIIENSGSEPDGDAGYNGDYWLMAADYIEQLKSEITVSQADKEFLKVFDSVPENLVQAWRAPQAIVGWYNDLGTAFKAWRGM